jgi:hypothetical protein
MQVSDESMQATWRLDGWEVALTRGLSPARAARERALHDAGRVLPLPHRAAWAAMQPAGWDSWFLTVADARGTLAGAVALSVAPSRALPGHLVLRCERFGPGVEPAARAALVQALALVARAHRRVLRLNVETFAIDDAERAALADALARAGFAPVAEPRCYEHTLLVPLVGDEEAIFASLHATARRHIRAVGKNPVVVAPVDDPAYFARLDEISRETYSRTGGTYDPPDWAKVAELCRREPGASRLVGIFRADVAGPERLLAFAWGCGHGDHVHYSRAGSTRATDLKMPLMYPVVWDLMRWARSEGARWFDFGGITMGSHESADPLGGISDFKRYFTGQVAHVGAEWSFEPRRLQARAAHVVSATSSFVSRMLARS